MYHWAQVLCERFQTDVIFHEQWPELNSVIQSKVYQILMQYQLKIYVLALSMSKGLHYNVIFSAVKITLHKTESELYIPIKDQ